MIPTMSAAIDRSMTLAAQVLERIRKAPEPKSPWDIISGLGDDREAARVLRDLVLEGRVQLTHDWKVHMSQK